MVFPNEATQMILERFPKFPMSEEWKRSIALYQGNEISIYGVMSSFSRYVGDLLRTKEKSEDFKKIFDFAEELMVVGDSDVQEAVSTCFLENLINVSSHGDFSPLIFVPYLGKESIKYCKVWDEFTGVKTEGLWGERKGMISFFRKIWTKK